MRVLARALEGRGSKPHGHGQTRLSTLTLPCSRGDHLGNQWLIVTRNGPAGAGPDRRDRSPSARIDGSDREGGAAAPHKEQGMGRLKAMVKSALDDRSPRFLLATVALGVVVALVAGFAIGYKVDDGDNGGTRRARPARQQGNKKPKAPKLKEAPLLVASVSSRSARKVIVLDATGKARPMGIGRKTRIFRTGDAKGSDVKVGSRVLFEPSATSKTTATEVVVLPDKAKLGLEVTAVKPGTSMSVLSLGGTQVIKTDGATFLKTTTGKRSNLVKGEKVVVRFFVVRGRRNQATDIVVLPDSTKFK
jgi:hypothetical protein